jgi:hypothetical protein
LFVVLNEAEEVNSTAGYGIPIRINVKGDGQVGKAKELLTES